MEVDQRLRFCLSHVQVYIASWPEETVEAKPSSQKAFAHPPALATGLHFEVVPQAPGSDRIRVGQFVTFVELVLFRSAD